MAQLLAGVRGMNSMIWIVVPAGRIDGGVRANVVVTPRLDAPTLAAAGMAQWPPEELAGATVRLLFAQTIDDAPAFALPAVLRPAAEPGLWARFFPPDTVIRANADAPDAPPAIVVQPAGADGAAVEAVFHAVAEAPLGEEHERHALLAAAADAALARNPLAPAVPPPDARAMRAARRAVAEAPDFHDRIGLLREHPTVQKALGLVLTFDVSALPAGLFERGVVSVECTGLPADLPTIASPWTAYQLTGGRFMAESRGTIEAGMVKIGGAIVGEPANRVAVADRVAADELAPAEWRILTVDVDTAPDAIRDPARRVAHEARAALPVPDAPLTAPLPALRSGGIAIARIGHGEAMNARGARLADAGPDGMNRALDAEDLLLGYRLDVKREGERWRSLSVRRASYLVEGVPLAVGAIEEEGHIKAEAALDYGDGTLRTDDIVARWTGWNHVTRRPAFVADTTAPVDGQEARRLDWVFETVPGAQPRLRFGASYRLRLRVADIAGGGLAIDDPLAENQTTQVVSYGRYEPVGSPDVLAVEGAPMLPGESVFEVVVRSDRDMTPTQFAAANPAYSDTSIRLLEPPRTAIGMAEQHKMMDDLDAAQSWAIVAPVLTGADPASRIALPDPAASGVAGYTDGMAAPAVLAWPKWPAVAPKGVKVQARVDPQEPVVGWRDDDLVIALAQAATASVEISSTLRETFEAHMAAKLDLRPDAAAAARIGRHPLVTPAIRVQATHAVRQPLRDPAGGLDVLRDAAATSATLHPRIAMFDIDSASTAKVEVSADWTEPDDVVTRTIVDSSVRDLRVDRGDADFAEPLVHEFGDTRHRQVAYTVRAISRFRHCFLPEEPDALFAATLRTGTVTVPSTAQPPALKLLGTAPAFDWRIDASTGGKTIRVRDGLLRIALARPWFATGEGEQLAIVVAGDGVPAADVHDLVSEAARDPIWATTAPVRWLDADRFSRAAGPLAVLTPPGASSAVHVVPHEVFYDPAADHWCCDVAIEGLDDSYAPLVRLAVARYQAQSLNGCSLSAIARTDFVPLLPRRTLTIERGAGFVAAQLAGIGPTGPWPNKVQALIEEAISGGVADDAPSVLSDDPSLPGWRAIRTFPDAELGARNMLELPAGPTRLRLVVREIEVVTPSPSADSTDPLSPRVVFEDWLPLD
jgi:hypothetical protein